ncbi:MULTISPECIES: DUF4214 domain-containing protein [Pseudomonas syringae group]|jgi:hypothetical protein|uniref:DUF4214 domain-containing protein n=2 Tax=Pseudomonas syringae group TaxID=136849 RepID=A0A3M4Y6M3_9PSED|nr:MULTISPECIES: DUF4214 domain-containing protein [Pseudomonas syringae group]EKG40244.1 hemolysin-type calcium-binding region [Pseudomonas syringae pv. avellanae str. ISPaVe037]ELS44431.1 Antifreeze protein [Pseudomonas syringae pv. syringae B64]MBS7412285.1 DUF4214 domain-containing protein [Pseudomonas syringae]MCF5649192.1 DUF4214 domain-containing protein [Pseudomonas syringae]MCF5734258.1 DUF4214 domain-containing protein [Pseudomonas syringae]
MQYDAPVTTTQFNTFLSATTLTDSTTAAISNLLALNTATSVDLASWDGVSALQIPTGQTGTTDVITGTIAGARGDLVTLNVTAEVAAAKAIILDSQANLNVNITPTIATDAAADVSSLARVAVSADASATTQFLLTTGTGDDVIIVNGNQNNYIDAGAGNDTIITGNGNNTVIAGVGNNNIITGTGNDTIVLSGVNHADVVNAGAGYDVVQLDGSVSNYTFTAGNNFNVNLTGAQTASITGAEFLTFVNTTTSAVETVVLAQNDTEATALRMFEGILGRDADLGGAQAFAGLANSGASLTDIANSFLNSSEFATTSSAAPISSLYTELLGRAADAGGLANWQAVVANGGTLADVAAGLAVSTEAQALDQSNGDFVRDLYTSALGRAADQGGLDSWVSQLFNGASRAEVAQGIVGSQEAAAKADSDFIDGLYQSAIGRAADAGGKAAWSGLLAGGGTHADVAIGIVGSPEAVAHNDNVIVLHGAV